MKPRNRFLRPLALTSLIIFHATSAMAQSTWNGSAGTNWSNAASWNPSAPAENGDVIIADVTTGNLLTLDDGSKSIGSLTFGDTGTRTPNNTAGAPNFAIRSGDNTLTNNVLTITGGVIANGGFTLGNALNIGGSLIIGAAQNWSVGGSPGTTNSDSGIVITRTGATGTGSLVMNGNLTKTGPGQLSIISTTVSGNGNFVVDEGALKLNAGNSSLLTVGGSGNITVNNTASLFFSRNSGTFSVTRDIVMNADSTLALGGGNANSSIASDIAWNGAGHTLSLVQAYILAGNWTGAGTVTKSGTGALTLTGDNTGFSGTLANSEGILNLNSGFNGNLRVKGGTTNIQEDFTGGLEVTGGTANVQCESFTGDITLPNDTFEATLPNLTIGANTTVTGNISMPFGGGVQSTLLLGGTLDGNLSYDENTTATFSDASITGNLETGDPSFAVEVELFLTGGPLQIGGELIVNGTLAVFPGGGFAPGTSLITFNNTTAPTGVTVAGAGNFRDGQTVVTNEAISLTYTPATITWTGANSNNWDINTTQNWETSGTPTNFFNGDTVIFPTLTGEDEAPLAATIAISPDLAIGGMTVGADSNYTFTGNGIGGSGAFTKTGTGTVTFSQTAANAFPGGFNLTSGTASITTNQQATGTGPLVAAGGTVLNSPPLTSTATATYGNSALSINNATWSFPGSSGGTVTHTYAFAGAPGSTEDTDPNTAIQISDSTLNFASTFGTTKAFNGRIHFTGNNTINRQGSNFTHNLAFNRTITGTGTLTFNFTNNGSNAGRVVNIGPGLTNNYTGQVILDGASTSNGGVTTFTLNSSLGPAAYEVRNGWNLTNNAAGGLDSSSEVVLINDASRLTLTQPVNNAGLDLLLGTGTLSLGNAHSTVGTLTATNATILSTGANAALTVTNAAGSVFSGSIGLNIPGDPQVNNSLNVIPSGINIGNKTIASLTQNSGGIGISLDTSGTQVATVNGAYEYNGGTLLLSLGSIPDFGVPYSILQFGSISGTGGNPAVSLTGSGTEDLDYEITYGANEITITFTSAPRDLAWRGGAEDGTWDTETANWFHEDNLVAFAPLDTVLFDDTATGLTSVSLSGSLTPSAVTFNNTALTYSLSGDGVITGGTTLTKNGAGSVSLGTANTYSGGTTVNSGQLKIGNDSALGSGTVTVQSGAVISSDGAAAHSIANPISLSGGQVIFGHAADSGNLTLTGTVSGNGGITKNGPGTLTLAPTSANTFANGLTISEGVVAEGAIPNGADQNLSATSTGPLAVSAGATLIAAHSVNNLTTTYNNSAITIAGAWRLPGESDGSRTHTYNFAGALGDTEETNPATAIQMAGGTLSLASTNTTTKNFNGRINFTGNNTINRESTAFTHSLNWNRAWYGGGTITINFVGGATGRSMTFNGAGSTFSGNLILNDVPESGSAPSFNHNQPLPASTIEVRSRWNLVNNTATGFGNTTSITVVDEASRLTLTTPIENNSLALIVGAGMINVGAGDSTVGTLSVNGTPMPAGTYTAALHGSFIEGAGSLIVLDGEPAGGSYEDWLTENGIDPQDANTAPDEDYDNDGLANMVEFVLGSHPDSGGQTNLPAATRVGNTLEFTFTRMKEALDAGFITEVEWSTTLAAGSWTTIQIEPEHIVASDATSEDIKVVIQVPEGADKIFARLKVTEPQP